MPRTQRCLINGCVSNSRDHKNINFFNFPPPGCLMYERWLEQCVDSAEKIKTTSRPVVCSKHFNLKSARCKRLSAEAVPTLFLKHTPEVIEEERLRLEQEEKTPRIKQLLEDVVFEWVKRAKHYPDMAQTCTSWNEMYHVANRVRDLLGANMYLRTETYWLRKFRGRHLAQLMRGDPAAANRSANLRDIIKELAPNVKISSEEEIAALQKKEREVLIENQKKKNIARERRQTAVELVSDESEQVGEAEKARIKKLLDEVVLEWVKRAKHYPDMAQTCTSWNEMHLVGKRTRDLLGANMFLRTETHWVRKFRGLYLVPLLPDDPAAANKSVDLRDIIKELAPDVKLLTEEEIAALQKKEREKLIETQRRRNIVRGLVSDESREAREAKKVRIRKVLEEVVLEWVKRAKHYPDIAQTCTAWDEMYQVASRVRDLLGANLYVRTEHYWLRKFRQKHNSQLMQIDLTAANKSVDLGDIIKELAPDVKIYTEDEIAALRKTEREILIENQKRKIIAREKRKATTIGLASDAARQAEDAKKARIRKLFDETVLEWIKRAKHYPDVAESCTSWSEIYRVAHKALDLLGAKFYIRAEGYWLRKFCEAYTSQMTQLDPVAANKSLDLRDIIKELAPDVKIFNEGEKVTERYKRKPEGVERGRAGLRPKRSKPYVEDIDASEHSSAESASSECSDVSSEDFSEDGGMNLDDGDSDAMGSVGGSFREADQIMKYELDIEPEQHLDFEEVIPLKVVTADSNAGLLNDSRIDNASGMCAKIKSEVSDSVEVQLIDKNPDTDDMRFDGKDADQNVRNEAVITSYEQALEYIKPLEDYALQQENYRLIGALTAVEKLLNSLMNA